MAADTALWTPTQDQIDAAPMTAFMKAAAAKTGTAFSSYAELHRWSIDEREAFWGLAWDFCGVVGDKGERVLVDGDRMPGAAFFPDARLNFAENLLKKTGSGDAIVFRGEDKVERRLSWNELNALTSRLQQLFLSLKVKKGDRIAAMMPNMPETVAAMLAAASIGAVWSSCSPDFGEQGVLDRFGQIEPVVFIAPDGYWYNGKAIEVADKVRAVAARLASVRKVLIVDYLGTSADVAATIDKADALEAALSSFVAKPVSFERLPFAHPLYILFSSGTTGIPKCIVHSAGGTLIQHVKEQRLHAGLLDGDRLFYFTTCGWMMWNWLVSGLASGATLLLYDGSPFYPDGNALFDFADAEKMTYFGTSAKFIDSVRKAGLKPIGTHDLSSVRTISSTGSPLSPEDFRFVYDGIKTDVHLASISGGTDIVSCFVLGVPIEPVWSGEIQGPGLGLAVDVWNDDGRPVRQEKGELVCAKAFPAMPIGFWNDPEDKKYRAAYFERFDNVWCHGDFAEWTAHGGMIIHGRSDATLNPGGVRIGTAEIYNQVEQMPEILEALCIGQDFDNDVRVVLFVRLAAGVKLDEDLEKRIRAKIRTGASPRHVPAKIVAVTDIPRTKSGKITELAVRDVVHGRAIKNKEALANPEALELFRNLPQLAD
ncbi:MAG: acetoacetate--CoA ligase [Mesorhizobium sp.]|uniref:acetoacetate--CoA ligase n=2 Tax=Mesorhizobium TaxID=68287 RepID=UPI000F756252|nr:MULTISPECIES: acetoacetate--CoA ligase [unclassified Mesorhizobium]RVD69926.1 acetoacetate--CoA ligase [Mesorhizobium sp. M4A.F.Ca.ET.029.04.2.1]AZO48987.1 acetoacetate--CoA ligase [Mesorhizobium sp. M4B.F.Ca.ET.058.02.1.1]RUX45558.1 acetoacetate--CoA ligase [Mesorhizobium sp. M4A.F.Ca.ET.050.02.1.1]RVC41038.1 acetoacetate--CoA ligase [Mesorhizobium sp. M4A.F.Ca.ET.090.04.2.1]RVD36467.1 acetoacetate--CoA ligase [Mesorhizobium sp. M4A.F.Ca.ET.020.02.1.1]